MVKPELELILIPGGEFTMGWRDGSTEENLMHQVRIKGFWLGRTEVTNRQYCEFLNKQKPIDWDRKQWIAIQNDRSMDDRHDWMLAQIEKKDGRYYSLAGYENYPVVCVSWLGADAFCRRYHLRLPTEAEWEYAAGGSMHDLYPWGEVWLPDSCCYGREIPADPGRKAPVMAVGSYPANDFGLCDMAGNVWEWCQDWYSKKYYRFSSNANPLGPYFGDEDEKVLRGGGWNSTPEMVGTGVRAYAGVGFLFSYNGFRCASN